uniref:Cytochrome c-553 n=1 Tax=Alexandrium monilatum TaxID=311494 RepID=A0A6T1KDS7_9DINO
MSRSACLVFAAFLALCAASCFLTPAGPRGPPAGPAGSPVRLANPAQAAETAAADGAAWSPLAAGVALGLLAAVLGGRPALAADLENGEGIFLGNCTACHTGGNNSIVAEKKLKKDALEKYLTGGYNVEAIKYQVTNGKGSMPAFGERLGPDDIEDVANYVYEQATKW